MAKNNKNKKSQKQKIKTKKGPIPGLKAQGTVDNNSRTLIGY